MLDHATIDGTELYYQDEGEGDPILFLHGFGGNHLIWWQQMAHFSRTNRAIALDQRMFGLSADAPDGPGASAFADDVEALLSHLGIDRAAVVAQSMGGWSAASFATQHPDRVAALVLADTPGGLLPPDWREEFRDDDSDDEDGDESGISGAYSEALSDELAFLYDSLSGLNVHRPAEFDEIHPDLIDLPADPGAIADAGFPTLLIVGEDDVLTPPPVIERVHDRIEGSELVVVPGAGHSVYFEKPAEFNRLVGDVVDAAEF